MNSRTVWTRWYTILYCTHSCFWSWLSKLKLIAPTAMPKIPKVFVSYLLMNQKHISIRWVKYPEFLKQCETKQSDYRMRFSQQLEKKKPLRYFVKRAGFTQRVKPIRNCCFTIDGAYSTVWHLIVSMVCTDPVSKINFTIFMFFT